MILWLSLACPPPLPIEEEPPPPPDSEDSEAPAPPPVILEVRPDYLAVSGGELLVISGTGFSADAEVFLGDVKVPLGATTPESIAFVAPAMETPGAVDLRVVQASGEALLPEAVRYYKEWEGASIGYLWGHFRTNRPERTSWSDYQVGFLFALGLPFEADPWGVDFGPDVPDGCTLVSLADSLPDPTDPLPAYVNVSFVGTQWRLPDIGTNYNRTDDVLPDGEVEGPITLSIPESETLPALETVEVGTIPEAPAIHRPVDQQVLDLDEGGLVVDWSSSGGEVVYLQLANAWGITLRCYLEDDGYFEIPADIMAGFRDDSSSENTPIAVEIANVHFREVDYPVADARVISAIHASTMVDLSISPETP